MSTLNTDETVIFSKSALSDKAILHNIKQGKIIIEPFNLSQLSTSSYDIRLGPNIYREQLPDQTTLTTDKTGPIFNPYSQKDVNRVWGPPQQGIKHSDWLQQNPGSTPLNNVDLDEIIIWIKPGETILGHTDEYIGGRITITSMMKARSSLGRAFIEVCKCAGKSSQTNTLK